MRKNRPFLELFATSLKEDYSLPILEVFAFFFVFGAFIFTITAMQSIETGEVFAYRLANSLCGMPLFIFIILVLKNISYGIGSDLERGTIQTFLSYPLKRRMILTAKLLSALGVATALFLATQIFALCIVAPEVIPTYLTTVILTYVANLCYPMLISGILLLFVLVLKKGGLALGVGILTYFVVLILSSLAFFISGSDIAIKTYAVINPSLALQMHYESKSSYYVVWAPSFSEVMLYIAAGYALVFLVFTIGYTYFQRRLGV
ncbi:MAG: ABC transporter permease subunit [Thermoproteota archaeon]